MSDSKIKPGTHYQEDHSPVKEKDRNYKPFDEIFSRIKQQNPIIFMSTISRHHKDNISEH